MIRLKPETILTAELMATLHRLGWRGRWVNGVGVTLERINKKRGQKNERH